jgi:hypothetical protein
MFVVPYNNSLCKLVCRVSVDTLKAMEEITGMMTMHQEVTVVVVVVVVAEAAEVVEVDKGGANLQEGEVLHVVEVEEEVVGDLDRVLILLTRTMVSR